MKPLGGTDMKRLHRDWRRKLDHRLDPDASASLVVQRHLGADSLAGWLAGEGWQVTRLRSRAGYRLLEVRR